MEFNSEMKKETCPNIIQIDFNLNSKNYNFNNIQCTFQCNLIYKLSFVVVCLFSWHTDSHTHTCTLSSIIEIALTKKSITLENS